MFSSLPHPDKKKPEKEAKQTWQEYLKQIRKPGSLTANELLDRAAASRQENRRDFDDYFIPDFEERRRPQKWSDSKIRAAAANDATRLKKDDRYAEGLAEAFEKFGLNPANPYNWRTLLEFFMLAHSEKPQKNIGRREWTPQSYCKLLTDYFVMRTKHPGKPATYIFDRLVETVDYKHQAAGRVVGKGKSLRRAFYHAKDEKKNWVLGYLMDFHLKQLQENNAKDKAVAVDRLRKAAKNRAIRDIVTGDCLDHLDVVLELSLYNSEILEVLV